MWPFKHTVTPSASMGQLDNWTPPAESGHDLLKRKSVLLLESLKPGDQVIIEHPDVNCVRGGATCTLNNAVHRLEGKHPAWCYEAYHPDHQEHLMCVRVTDDEHAEKETTTAQ